VLAEYGRYSQGKGPLWRVAEGAKAYVRAYTYTEDEKNTNEDEFEYVEETQPSGRTRLVRRRKPQAVSASALKRMSTERSQAAAKAPLVAGVLHTDMGATHVVSTATTGEKHTPLPSTSKTPPHDASAPAPAPGPTAVVIASKLPRQHQYDGTGRGSAERWQQACAAEGMPGSKVAVTLPTPACCSLFSSPLPYIHVYLSPVLRGPS